MQALNSEWLIARIERSAHEPRQRLLNAFDIVAEHIKLAGYPTAELPSQQDSHSTKTLDGFLAQQARIAGIEAPDVLAQQLHFMLLQAAAAEKTQPGCKALQHAKTAAAAIIQAQTEKPRKITKPFAYGMAASLFSIVGAASLLLQTSLGSDDLGAPMPKISLPAHAFAANVSPEAALQNPAKTAAIYASIEHMRTGVCYYPQALILPADERAIYIENIVNGQISNKANELQVVDRLMEQVSCNYTPMLMKNSTG